MLTTLARPVDYSNVRTVLESALQRAGVGNFQCGGLDQPYLMWISDGLEVTVFFATFPVEGLQFAVPDWNRIVGIEHRPRRLRGDWDE